ncbi:MAG: nuclear transport factor 2 family protein [Miltoncostaeaceae bacterium]|jgi:ketosteroid isomerase-like protein
MTTTPSGATAVLVDRLFDIADDQGLARALEGLSPDITWTQYDIDNRPAAPQIAHGRAEAEVLLRKGMAPGMTHRVVRFMESDDDVACHVECAYPDGAKVECTYLMTVRDGLVTDVLGTMSWDG